MIRMNGDDIASIEVVKSKYGEIIGYNLHVMDADFKTIYKGSILASEVNKAVNGECKHVSIYSDR